MSATHALFVRWMAHKRITSERAGCLALGLSAGTAHHWKAGRNGSLAVIEQMAKDLGEDYVPHVMAAFQETAPNEAERKAWKRLAKRLGAAAVLTMACMVTPQPVHAGTTLAGADVSVGSRHYAKSRRRVRKSRKLRTRAGALPETNLKRESDPSHVQGPGGGLSCRSFRHRHHHATTTLHHPRTAPQRLC